MTCFHYDSHIFDSRPSNGSVWRRRKCNKCGDKQHTVEQREEAEREAILTMRTQHTLLTGKEIKHFRESVGLSTAQLGELLHGLPKGIVEGWEKGRYLQSPVVDAMLRSLTDRDERERRAARAGLLLPPVPGELVSGVAGELLVDAVATDGVSSPDATDARRDSALAEPEAVTSGVQE